MIGRNDGSRWLQCCGRFRGLNASQLTGTIRRRGINPFSFVGNELPESSSSTKESNALGTGHKVS